MTHISSGKYEFKIYKIGYRINDPYSTYLDLGSPNQLTRSQSELIKKNNDGSPVTKSIIDIPNSSAFTQEFDCRENDFFLVTLVKIRIHLKIACPEDTSR